MTMKKLLLSVFSQKAPPRAKKASAKDESYAAIDPDVPTIDFEMLANSYIWEHYNKDRLGRPQGYFHPSSGLHPNTAGCKRAIVFDLLCSPRVPKTNVTMLKIFDNGDNRHVGLGKLFTRMARDNHFGIGKVELEKRLQHSFLPIAGNADAIVTMDSGDRYLIDFKTKGSKGCKSLKEPEQRHRMQVLTYMMMARVGAGYVLYENKDSQAWAGPAASFYVRYDEKTVGEIEEFCIGLLESTKRKKLPVYVEADCDRECLYAEICTAERRGLARWDAFDRRTPETRASQEVCL
jgi:hypothetical protein